jgi:hypothetical protein
VKSTFGDALVLSSLEIYKQSSVNQRRILSYLRIKDINVVYAMGILALEPIMDPVDFDPNQGDEN